MNNPALITGASSGIGKELARIHAKRGGDLVLVARREDKLNELKSELEEQHSVCVFVIPKDLTSPTAATQIFEAIRAEGIELEFLINNAGFGGHGRFHDRDWQQELSQIQLNIIALTKLCHLFIPEFVQRNHGRILNVSSTASLPPGGPLQSVYYATKNYVTAFSYGIAVELEGTNVTVTTLMPGATETEFARSAGMDKTKLFSKTASANSVAQDGYDAMLAGKLDVVTGLTFSLKLMMSAMNFMPKKMVLKQIHKMQETKE
jgi:short-subunit dehydrogenase